MKCIYCGKANDKEKLPRGWKRTDKGDPICDVCWNDRYVLRSITFPIVGPLDPAQWPELREALSKAWGDSTRLANWLMTEHAKADRVRMPADEKLWKAPNPYLYPHARKVCPEMASQSVVSICNAVQRKYNSARIDIVWRGAASLPSFRYPMPYPLPKPAWRPRFESGAPIINVPISGVSFDLVLRGSAEFQRQLSAFSELVSGNATKCEMAIYRKTAHSGDHRNGDAPHSRIMVKLVMWLPRPAKKELPEKVLALRRPATSFWLASISGCDDWVLHCDQVAKWIIGHTNRLGRLSDDTKREKRWPKQQGASINTYRAEICRKQNHRIDTFGHVASKMLAEYAARHRVTKVVYEDADNGYLTSFPWFDLRTKLDYKLRERGIALEIVEGSRG